MTLYKKKYRVESARLPGKNYAANGLYFVTICTRKKLQWFGEVKNGQMNYSSLGKTAVECLRNVPMHFPHARVRNFIVMPDHVHAIVEIKGRVETQNFASLQNKFGPQSRNLGSIVRGYKIGVKKAAGILGFSEFQWQSRFHDHIIRSEKELHAIRRYIASNPATWDKETIPWHDDATFWNL